MKLHLHNTDVSELSWYVQARFHKNLSNNKKQTDSDM